MPEIDWARAKAVLDEVLEAAPEAREAELRRRCGGDEPLRAAGSGLLAALDDSDDFLAEPEAAPGGPGGPGGPAPAPTAPPRVGAYELHEVLGEGGFGVVHRATQREPVEREVAIKLLKPGHVAATMVRRFEAERHVLARMEHPGIAKLLDAGATEDRRSYVVMELVRGASIVDYCRDRNLPVRQRVALVSRACRAVHHAHQRAVIHRDLKPSNILVTEVDGRPEPRIIDFGIAKVLSEAHEEDHTRAGDVLGTPRYMSPEQIGGGVIDTRVDVYALGVVLCQTLTGAVPRSADSMSARPPRETPAERPSRLATSAGPVLEEGAALGRALRGDLDRIVMQCVEWEPDRRYDSAAALADELDRYLRGEPVLAAGPGVLYRAGKFLRRHRLAATLGTAAALSLVLGTVLALVGLGRAVHQRQLAEQAEQEAARQADRAEFVSRFLLADILEAMNPDVARGRDVTVRELLDVAAARASDRFAGDPELHVDVLGRLGIAYAALLRAGEAVTMFERALTIADAAGADPVLVMDLRVHLAEQLILARRHAEGFAMRAANRDDAVGWLGPAHPLAIRARLHASRSSIDDPAALLVEIEDLVAALGTEGDATDLLLALQIQASTVGGLGRHDEAVALLEEAEALARSTHGREHTSYRDLLGKHVAALVAANRPEEAEPKAREQVALYELVHGPEDGAVVAALYKHLQALRRLGRHEEALEAAQRAERIAGDAYGEESIPHSTALSILGAALVDAGRVEAGLAVLERALELRRRQWGDGAAMVGHVRHSLARAHLALDDATRALEHADAALDRLEGAAERSAAGVTRARALHRLGRGAEAAAFLREAIATAEAANVDAWSLDSMALALRAITGG